MLFLLSRCIIMSIRLRHRGIRFYSTRKQDIPTPWKVSVVCNGKDGTANTILLDTPAAGYMFNCGETTQRCLMNNHFSDNWSFNKINNIFLTSTSYTNMAGLLGYCLSTKQRSPKEHFTIHGHNDNSNIFGLLQLYTEIRLLKVLNADWQEPSHHKFVDGGVRVEYVKLWPTSVRTGDENDDKYAVAYIVDINDKSNALSILNKYAMRNYSTLEFEVVKNSTPSGKQVFDVRTVLDEVAYDWVRSGQVKQAKLGAAMLTLDILQQQGLYSYPKPVNKATSPSVSRVRFLVLECPSEKYLESLLSSEQLKSLTANPGVESALIVHMSPSSIIQHERFKEFMARFGQATHHLMLNKNSPVSYIRQAHQWQKVLNHIHPATFPAIQSHMEFDTPPTVTKGNIVQGFNGLQFVPGTQPHFELSEGLYQDDLYHSRDGFNNHLEDTDNMDEDYPEVVFLGTSSGTSNWVRNPSGILLQTRRDRYMMFDCGEGSLQQLYQLYGDQLETVLANIQAIILSHLHYDHIGGLPSLIEARSRACKKLGINSKLRIIAPKIFLRWVTYFERYFGELSSKLSVLTHEDLQKREFEGRERQIQNMKKDLALPEITPVSVQHTETAYGTVLQHVDGWKLVYSGDCRPTPELVTAGKGCDILIHEGTYPDKQVDEAKRRKHSTIGEAIGVARQMEAKFTVVTHLKMFQPGQMGKYFSDARYANIAFAYDFMKVRRNTWKYIKPIKLAMVQAFPTTNTHRDISKKLHR